MKFRTYNPILSRATYTRRVVVTSSRASEVSHLGLTHERIDYIVTSSLVLEIGGVWTDVRDASTRSETE